MPGSTQRFHTYPDVFGNRDQTGPVIVLHALLGPADQVALQDDTGEHLGLMLGRAPGPADTVINIAQVSGLLYFHIGTIQDGGYNYAGRSLNSTSDWS